MSIDDHGQGEPVSSTLSRSSSFDSRMLFVERGAHSHTVLYFMRYYSWIPFFLMEK